MTPTSFTIVIGTDAVFTALPLGLNDRLEIHLPGFGGAYNSFGARHSDATVPSGWLNHMPEFNGISGVDATGTALTGTVFNGAEWDASREVRNPSTLSHPECTL